MKCKHPADMGECLIAAEWCAVCGAIRVVRCGKFGKWIEPTLAKATQQSGENRAAMERPLPTSPRRCERKNAHHKGL